MEVESKIRFLSGPLTEQIINLPNSEVFIGRDTQNYVCVQDPKVSRRHARIYRQGDSWMIENLSQTSFVAVNQQRVKQSVLQNNAIVKLGESTSFVFLVQQAVSVPLSRPPDGAKMSTFPSGSSPSMARADVAPERTIATNMSPTGTIYLPPLESGVPSLALSSNVHSSVLHYSLTKPVMTIGRDPGSDIATTEAVVSGQHARIVHDGDKLFLEHPHPDRPRTLNGLWYQGVLVRGDQRFRRQLVHGDIFRIGSESGTMVTFAYDDGSGTSTEKSPEMPPIALTKSRLTIGRAPENDVVLNHMQVSAQHASLEKVKGGYRILDNRSTNHVYVNAEPVTDQVLRTNDEIRIGPYRFNYTGTELKPYDDSSNIRIDAQNLKKVGNNAVVLLNNISLTIPPRKFVALVGGSGAGKSTLMDALNGLRPAQEGVVSYNGVDYYRNLAAFSTQLGYVPQEDIVHRDLTVERALYYAARLRLPSDMTKEQIQRRIDEVLEDVEVAERRKLMISALSGGQRKRVSIALELLANPSVFFLDEPTSGLDPGLDRKMMALLRRLADRGRTIVLVTHATNNINACDYVCFLARGGQLAYFGPPNSAKEYFEKTDFAEIYSELEPTKDRPNVAAEAAARFRQSSDYEQYVLGPMRERPGPEQTKKPSPGEKKRKKSRRGQGFSQFRLLSTRYIELLKNDTGNLLLLLLQAPVIAVLVVLMSRFQMGADIFAGKNVVQCQSQIAGPSGGALVVPQPQGQHESKLDCSKVQDFLSGKNDPQGEGQKYAQSKGKGEDGQKKALQDFIRPGSGTNAQQILFIMALISVLFGCINGSRELVKEVPIYKRERAVNLGILPYMFSKIVVLGVICLFQSTVLTLIVEAGQPFYQGVFLPPLLETYITLTLTSLAGLMIGLTISAIVPTNDSAISMLIFVIIPQVVFSGAIIPQKDWVSQILATIWPTRWAMTALGTSIGLHATVLNEDRLFDSDETYHSLLFSTFSKPDATNRITLSWLALGGIILVLMIIIGIFLKRKDARS
jgi:ABC-type multidrug transport system ATPase subunit/pSer/pThr/pTyr-binding forkhead associated (FHA) protein